MATALAEASPGHGLVGVNALKTDTGRGAFGDRLQALAEQLATTIERTSHEHHRISKDALLTNAGIAAAQLENVAAGLGRVADVVRAPAKFVAGKLTAARKSVGVRKLNIRDLPDPATSLHELDIADRISIARRELLSLGEGELMAALMSAFGATDDSPDVLVAYSVDSAPGFIQRRLELRSNQSIDELRGKLLERLNPSAAAAAVTWDEVGSHVFYDGHTAKNVISESTGITSPEAQQVVEAALEPLAEALQL